LLSEPKQRLRSIEIAFPFRYRGIDQERFRLEGGGRRGEPKLLKRKLGHVAALGRRGPDLTHRG
jgi:hypothetical protein